MSANVILPGSNFVETPLPEGARPNTFNQDSPELHPNLPKRKLVQKSFFLSFKIAALINALALLFICGFVVINGLPAISWGFLTEMPRDSMAAGGIAPAIVGTIMLAFGSMLLAFPVGVAAAVYLVEYARPGRLNRFIRLGISNLAGVPSIVFGLFGLAFFSIFLGWGVSALSGIATLGILILPVIIGTAEEALQAVPQTWREASLGLGGTKWQTISKVVLPAALPGMLTGAILGISRAAGETAAIMFTAAVFYRPTISLSIFDSVMALPYHIYMLATGAANIEETRVMQYGTTLVLMVLVLGMNILAIFLRSRLQRR